MKTNNSRRNPGLPALILASLTLLALTATAQQWTTNNLPSGLIAWWAAEGDLLDSAGVHHGSGSVVPSFGSGRHGQSFQFNGIDQSVQIPDGHADLDGWTHFTLEAWVNLDRTDDAPGPGRSVISKVGNHRGPYSGNFGYQFGFANQTSKLFCQFNTDTLLWPGYQTMVDVPDICTNVWYHVAATYDHNAVKLYLNGVPLVTNVIGPVTIANTVSTLRISKDDNDNVAFAGRIDDARIYNRALTATEIAGLAEKLQTIRLVATQNAHIDAAAPDNLFQDWGIMDVFSYRPVDARRVLLQFDLSALPAGAVITSVKLGVCSRAPLNYVHTEAQEVWRVENDAWSQATVTWNNFVSGPSNYVAALSGGVGQHYSVWELDVNAWNPATDLADGKLSVLVKYPAVLEGDHYYRGAGYYSRAVPNANNGSGQPDADIVPYLEITYSGNPPVIPPPLIAVSVPTTNSLPLTWNTFPGWSYQLQAATALETTNWTAVTGTNYASELFMTNTIAAGTNGQRFFRVQQFSR